MARWSSPNQGGGANWPPPSFSPQTGLFYVNATHAYSVYYIYDEADKPEGWGGNDQGGWAESMLQAIDYQTGRFAGAINGRRPESASGVSQHRGQPGLYGRPFKQSGGVKRDDGPSRCGTRIWD